MTGTPLVPLAKTLDRIRAGLGTLNRKMAPAQVAALELIIGAWLSQAIAVAAELGLADHLSSGPKKPSELAPKVGAHGESLFRLLRALSAYGFFHHHRDDSFSLTAMGECLRSDVPHSVRDMARFVGSPSHWTHWRELLYAVKTGKTSVERIEGMGFFKWLGQNPDEARLFDGAMTSVSEAANGPVVAAYDFSGFKEILDVGGGHGSLLSAILRAYPRTSGAIFDLAHTQEGARARLQKDGVADRAQLIAGDFFESIPGRYAAYILKNIIHDWPEEDALRLLKNLRGAVPDHGKLLLVEAVLPRGPAPHVGKLIDLEMLVSVGGRERTRVQYRELLAQAGFKLTAVVPTVAPVSLIESRPV